MYYYDNGMYGWRQERYFSGIRLLDPAPPDLDYNVLSYSRLERARSHVM